MSLGKKTANAIGSVAASQTDSALIAAVTGSKIRVLSVSMSCGGATATASTFTSKPAGSGVAISAVFTNALNATTHMPYNPHGHFETVVSEGLSVTTGAGSTTGYQICYELV